MKAARRNLAGTAVLLAVASAVVVFAFFGIVKRDEATHARKEADARLYAFAPAKVKALAVEAKGDSTRLVRAGDGWRLEAPVQAEAERATVDALVDRVAELRRKASVADAPAPDVLSRYGLATPRARVTLTLDDGKVETLALGDENAFDGTAFVRTTGGAVELVGGDLRWAMERSTLDLREKRVLPLDEPALQRIEVVAPGLSYALSREGAAAPWRLEAPVKERADDATVGRVLGALRGLRATSFVPGPARDAEYGLDRPRWTVKVVVGGTARTLRLGEPPRKADAGAPALYGRVDGAAEVAVLPAGSTKDLEQDLAGLRDKAPLHVSRDLVAALRFSRGESSFEVRRDTAPTRLGALAWTLTGLRGKAIAAEAPAEAHGLAHPALEVSLLGADGKELDRLIVGPERGGKTYARAASSPRVFEIDPASLSTLPRTAEDAQEKPASAVEAKAGPK